MKEKSGKVKKISDKGEKGRKNIHHINGGLSEWGEDEDIGGRRKEGQKEENSEGRLGENLEEKGKRLKRERTYHNKKGLVYDTKWYSIQMSSPVI